MPRVVEKPEALALLAENRRALLGSEDGCVMCALVRRARETRAELIAESEHGVVVLDRFGSRLGHSLVISRRHVEETTALGFAVYAELQRLAYEACAALGRTLAPARTFLAVLGASAQVPMSFPHFHIHVLPVYETGEGARPANVFSWSAGVLVYEDGEAAEVVTRVRAGWRSEP